MKKFLAIAFIAAAFAACNNSSEKKTDGADTTKPAMDTAAPAPAPVVDTTKKDTAVVAAPDTAAKK